MSVLPGELLPVNSTISVDGRLAIAGCDVGDLAREFGTPLFIYDEAEIRQRCQEAVATFGEGVAYATKAFLCRAMAQLACEEGMGLDVATGGELHVALDAGVPPDRLVMHGNNKSLDELRMALAAGVARIVIDSLDEIDRIERLLAQEGFASPSVLVRVNPGVEAHTHEFLQTGVTDSKFGLAVANEVARDAIDRASRTMNLVGLHAHIGSQVFDVESFRREVEVLAPFVNELGLPELSIGGGLGVAYVEGEHAPSISEWGRVVHDAAVDNGITARVVAEPGRAIIAHAAITVYTIGTIKEIDDVRTYVAVDGGMSDNPRPVLYGSGYEAFLPRAANVPRDMSVRIVGMHCESGDVLVADARLPLDIAVGDLVATPVTGAYGHSMASNDNMARRPPVVFAADGQARLVVRRETYHDLLRRDI